MSKQITFKTDDSMERILGLLENLDRVWDLQVMEINFNSPVRSLPVNNDIGTAMQLGQVPGYPTRPAAPPQPEKGK